MHFWKERCRIYDGKILVGERFGSFRVSPGEERGERGREGERKGGAQYIDKSTRDQRQAEWALSG